MSISDDQLVELLLIPGIGRAKARVLYAQGFRSLKDLYECPFEELSEIPGVGTGLASSIKEYAEVMLDVDEKSSDKLETTTGLSMCPMCGSLLAEDAEKCANCSVAFELDDEELAPSPEIDPDVDGFWYKKDETQFFLCPECGSLISEDATQCGKCGVAFEPAVDEPEKQKSEEVEELMGMLVKKAEEHHNEDPDVDGSWYKKEAQLFLCPECGAFISEDATNCEKCGIAFEAEDEEAGPESLLAKTPEISEAPAMTEAEEPDAPVDHMEEEAQIFLCTECGALISEESTQCANCGVALEPVAEEQEPEIDDETRELEHMLVTKSPDDEIETWHKKDAQLYLCPNCGSFLTSDADNCEHCGVVFEDDDKELEAAPEIQPDKPDDHKYTKKDVQIFLCTECGALISEEAVKCSNCGAVYEEVEAEIIRDAEMEKRAEREIEELSALLVEKTEDEEAEAQMLSGEERGAATTELHLCPGCGSFVLSDLESCPDCGIVLGMVEEEVEVKPDDLMLDIDEPLEALAKDEEIKGILDEISSDMEDIEALAEADTIEVGGLELVLAEEKDDEIDDMELEEPEEQELEEPEPEEEEAVDLIDLAIDEEAEALAEADKGPGEDLGSMLDILIGEEDEPEEPEAEELDLMAALELDEARPKDDGDLLEELELDEAETGILEDLEVDLILPDLEEKPEMEIKEEKEEKRGISKDFLSRWTRLGDEDDDKLEDLELEDAKPAIPTKDFIKQLQDETSWEEEEDSDLPDVVEIGEVVVLEDLDALDQKITDDPENDALWARKARLLSKAGSFEKAISCYDKAAELNVDMEAEYKKLILEILHGTAISDSPDELDELDLDTDIVDTDAAKARLKEIDEDLALFPGTESLLQEKGELLDQLGMHEAALECYNQVIQSSYKGIEAIARKKKYSDYPDSLQIGFTDGDGRVNGRINGILLGRVNGRINGLTNGRVNGLTNGRINGLVNGRSKVNGLTNGRINGLVNGRSKVNGLVNGKVNGLVNGLTNGKVNGLPFTFGGLINGMGLINGDGLVSSRSRLHRSKAKGYASSLWRTRVSVMVVLIFMMMIVPVLTNMMVEDGSYGMSIDGDFADWREFTSYHDSSQDQISNDDLNIIETKINFRPPNIFLYLRVDGDILGGRSTNDTSGVDSIFIFVDTDSDSSTGYNVSGMGADVLLAIHGWVNTAQSADVLRFDNELDHDDWKGFEYSHRTVTALQDGELELRVALNELDTYSQPILLIMTQDSFGERDVADSMITPLYGTLRVSMTEAVDGDILLPGESDAGMIRLESFGRDSEVLDMTFGLQGQLEVDGMDNLRLLMDTDGDGLYNPLVDEEIEATPVQNGRSFTFTLEDSLEIEANEQLDIFLAFDVAQATAAENVGVKIISLAVSDGVLVQIAENSGSLHNIGAADTIEIDGAFGDWENVGQNIDAANDVTNGNINHNQTRINRNVDISDYRLSVDDRLLVYTSVAGVAMGGIDVPMIRYRPVYVPPANVTPTPIPDSDNDGVPDVHDGPDGSLAHDFDNDGVDDADSGGDRDGDGIIDYGYDGGQDYWLNTTIPLDFDAEYANRTVSRFIGPIAPVQVQIKGLDYLSIYIDSDNNISTGAYINGRLGADHMALVSGRNNVIVSSELYRYDRSFLIPWVKVADMTSALDYHRMEMGVPLSLLGISALDEFSISLEMSDWKHSQDVSDEPLDHIALATGTRAAPIDDEPRAPPTPVPLVTIAKSVDLRTAEPGDYLNYTITLTNKRKAETAAFVWVNDTLPSGVTYVSDTSGLTPSVNGDTYTYPYTNLVADTTITFVITVRVDDTTADGTTLLNNVDVDFTDSTGTPYGTDTDSASTDCVRPDISVEKVANTTTAYPGTLVTYTIWYNNTGGGNAGDVWINDTIPGGTIFQSSTPAPTTVNGDDYTWYFPNVRKNTVNSITITVMVDPLATPGTTITNWASLNYTALNGHAFAEQSDSAVINVIIIPEFSTIAPLALGILGLAFVGFRRRKEVIR